MTDNPWRDHGGGPMPCNGVALVDVKFRDGESYSNTPADLWNLGVSSWWRHEGSDHTDIIAWRYAAPEDAARVAALDEAQRALAWCRANGDPHLGEMK